MELTAILVIKHAWPAVKSRRGSIAGCAAIDAIRSAIPAHGTAHSAEDATTDAMIGVVAESDDLLSRSVPAHTTSADTVSTRPRGEETGVDIARP